jgi:hypothetical protein
VRIRESGSSSSGFGRQSKDSERSDRFRKGHRAGQMVMEWQSPGLAWVEIDGQRMLAQVSEDAVLGRERMFLVVQLSPDIVLRELHDKPSGLNVLV